MSKTTYTTHGMKRMKERAGVKNTKQAEHMVNVVMERGITYESCQYKIDQNYLQSRTRKPIIAYAYNGYCYIINIKTKVVITMYPLPKSFGKKKGNYFEKDNKKYNRGIFKAENMRVCCEVGDGIMEW